MDKLSLEHNNPQEEQIQVTDSLIPPPTMMKRRNLQQKRRQLLRKDTRGRKLLTMTEDLGGSAQQ